MEAELPYPKKKPLKVSNNLKKFLTTLEKSQLPILRDEILIKDDCYAGTNFHINGLNLKTDILNPCSLVNRNTTIRNFGNLSIWAERQLKYLQSLSWEEKIIVISYTYGGDRMVNSFLLQNPIDSYHLIPDEDDDLYSPYSRFLSCKIFPLTLFLFQDVNSCQTKEQFSELYGWVSDYFKGELESLWKKIKGKTFSQSYEPIFLFFVEHRSRFPLEILENYVIRFTNSLDQIIRNAPKTTIQFWLYRGIDKKDYVVVGNKKRHVFTNTPFMSTTFDVCKASNFKDSLRPCCIQQILIPKGVSCLFISLISSFQNEEEVVFPPNCYLYPLTNDYRANNVYNTETRKFVVAN